MFGLRDSDIEAILGATSQYPEIEQVVIFGSRAKNTFRLGSDVDIAIKGDNVTENIVKSLSSQLNEDLPLPYFFDLVHYEEIDSQDLKEHIDRVGKDLSENKEGSGSNSNYGFESC